jgi:ABC-type sugar transport system ATPase subunit
MAVGRPLQDRRGRAGGAEAGMNYLVELIGVSKSFGAYEVLKNVNFNVRPGEVHALLGENGAGKSTLIKIIAGVHEPSSGEIRVEGKLESFASPKEACNCGIATVYQEMLLFPELTVTENIYLGHAPRLAWGGLDWERMKRQARALLDSLDSHDLDEDAVVGTLSVANRQRVEIAKALSQDAKIVVMDEPTAALAETDVERLLMVVRRLRERGVGVIYVSHRMPEIFAIADRVTVLRDGSHIGTRAISEVNQEMLVSMMVGRSIEQLFPKVAADLGPAVLEVRNVSYHQRVQNVSLQLRAGEILGIAGLVGSGRTELALTLFGITPASEGQILVDGRHEVIDTPRRARDLGIAYIPEDRGLQGLIRPQTIRENIAHAILDRIARASFVDRSKERTLAAQAISQFSIKARGPEQTAGTLSGGNQQKVVIAKWLGTTPKILIMDEPTRGIDVGAKSEIYALMSKLAQQGMAIIMISSELPEVLGMSDRILVMSDGRMVAELTREEATLESIGAAMTRGKHQVEAGQ